MGQDPRRDFSVPIPVELRVDGGEPTSEYAVNLSPRGLCLHLSEAITVGERVSLSFSLPPDEGRIEASGKVVWTSHDGEVGVANRFYEAGIHLEGVSDEDRERLRHYASQPILRRR